MRGTPSECKRYNSKEDEEPLELGEMPAQGCRTDLKDIKDAIDQGATMNQLWEDHFPTMVKYDQAIKRYKHATAVPRNSGVAPRIEIRIGPSGCGKTRACPPPSEEVYWHNGGKWWDGYSGQTTVVFDEFYGQVPYNDMLRILDRHPLSVEMKGSMAQLQATKFIFTSNAHPSDWWKKMQEKGQDLLAFQRRIEEFGEIIEMQ